MIYCTPHVHHGPCHNVLFCCDDVCIKTYVELFALSSVLLKYLRAFIYIYVSVENLALFMFMEVLSVMFYLYRSSIIGDPASDNIGQCELCPSTSTSSAFALKV